MSLTSKTDTTTVWRLESGGAPLSVTRTDTWNGAAEGTHTRAMHWQQLKPQSLLVPTRNQKQQQIGVLPRHYLCPNLRGDKYQLFSALYILALLSSGTKVTLSLPETNSNWKGPELSGPSRSVANSWINPSWIAQRIFKFQLVTVAIVVPIGWFSAISGFPTTSNSGELSFRSFMKMVMAV